MSDNILLSCFYNQEIFQTNVVEKIKTHSSRTFGIVISFAGFCYGRFMIMRYKFNLVTYVQRPLVVDRRGGTERNLNEITGGSR